MHIFINNAAELVVYVRWLIEHNAYNLSKLTIFSSKKVERVDVSFSKCAMISNSKVGMLYHIRHYSKPLDFNIRIFHYNNLDNMIVKTCQRFELKDYKSDEFTITYFEHNCTRTTEFAMRLITLQEKLPIIKLFKAPKSIKTCSLLQTDIIYYVKPIDELNYYVYRDSIQGLECKYCRKPITDCIYATSCSEQYHITCGSYGRFLVSVINDRSSIADILVNATKQTFVRDKRFIIINDKIVITDYPIMFLSKYTLRDDMFICKAKCVDFLENVWDDAGVIIKFFDSC